jgi:hypothetical protein
VEIHANRLRLRPWSACAGRFIVKSAASPCGRVCAGRYRGCCTPSCPAFSHCRHRPLQRGFRQRAIAATPQDAEGDPQALIPGAARQSG